MTLFSLRANFFLYISKPFPYLTLHSFPVIFYPSFSLYMSFFPLSLVGESLPYSCFLFYSSFPHFIIMVFFKPFPFPPFPPFSYLTDHSLIFLFFVSFLSLPLPSVFTLYRSFFPSFSLPVPSLPTPFILHLYRPPVALLLTLNLALSTPSISITLHLQHP